MSSLKLAGIQAVHRIVVNREALKYALETAWSDPAVNPERLPPIIHISIHGNFDGIALTDGSFVEWDELRDWITPVNASMGTTLIISMSACQGFTGCRMAMTETGDLPYFALIGPTRDTLISDLAIGFTVFYSLISKGRFLEDALRIANQAMGGGTLSPSWAVLERQDYLDFLQHIRSGRLPPPPTLPPRPPSLRE